MEWLLLALIVLTLLLLPFLPVGRSKPTADRVERIRLEIQSGRCRGCGGVLFRCESPSHREMVACENTYGGQHLLLAGSRRCVGHVYDLELLNEYAALYGTPPIEAT